MLFTREVTGACCSRGESLVNVVHAGSHWFMLFTRGSHWCMLFTREVTGACCSRGESLVNVVQLLQTNIRRVEETQVATVRKRNIEFNLLNCLSS